MYLKSLNVSDAASVMAVRGTQTADWEGHTIRLSFEVEYQIDNGQELTKRISFIGRRRWTDTYAWSCTE